jgi:hypothetical protein
MSHRNGPVELRTQELRSVSNDNKLFTRFNVTYLPKGCYLYLYRWYDTTLALEISCCNTTTRHKFKQYPLGTRDTLECAQCFIALAEILRNPIKKDHDNDSEVSYAQYPQH